MIERIVILRCDGCGVDYDGEARSGAVLRASAREDGWERGPMFSLDVCPDCAKRSPETTR